MSGWREHEDGRRRARCTSCGKDRMCNEHGVCARCGDWTPSRALPNESPETLNPALWRHTKHGVRVYVGDCSGVAS